MSFPRGAHGVDSSELVAHPLHAPVGVTSSCMNVSYELCKLTSTPLPPTAGESYPSCMNVTCVSPGTVHDVDSSELVAHPLHAPVGVTHSCVNVKYELYELTSTPSPPTTGESYPSCINVTYGLSLSLGASSPTPSPLGELASPVWMLLTLLCLSLGAAHGVDSSELAFRLAAIGAMREGKRRHVRSQVHS